MRRIFVMLGGIIIIVIGIILLITGKAKIKRCNQEVVGKVVDIEEEISTDEDNQTTYTYYPVIEYKAGEETISKKSETGFSSGTYKINDEITILYNPNKIDEYIIKGDNTGNVIGIIFIVSGILVFLIGLFKRF